MLAAAATIWLLFSTWLVAPHVGMPPRATRAAMTVLVAELVALGIWSYGTEGCIESTCAPVAQAAGVAARTDLPVLAAIVIALAFHATLRRAAPSGSTRSSRRAGRRHSRPAARAGWRRARRRSPPARRAR